MSGAAPIMPFVECSNTLANFSKVLLPMITVKQVLLSAEIEMKAIVGFDSAPDKSVEPRTAIDVPLPSISQGLRHRRMHIQQSCI